MVADHVSICDRVSSLVNNYSGTKATRRINANNGMAIVVVQVTQSAYAWIMCDWNLTVRGTPDVIERSILPVCNKLRS